MKIAHIKDGFVVNISVAAEGTAVPDDGTCIASETARIGDAAVNGRIVEPVEAAPTVDALLVHLNRAHEAHLGKVWTFNVGTEGKPLEVTTRLDAAGQAAMLQIQAWAVMIAQSGDVLPYSNVDFSDAVLTKEQAILLAMLAAEAKVTSYAKLNVAAKEILATPPTITSFAQIDETEW